MPVTNSLQLLVSGDGSAPLHINQDARIYAGRINKGDALQHAIAGKAYLLVAEGNLLVNDLDAHKGDGVAINDEGNVTLKAETEAEVLVIEVPGLQDAR